MNYPIGGAFGFYDRNSGEGRVYFRFSKNNTQLILDIKKNKVNVLQTLKVEQFTIVADVLKALGLE